MSDLSKSIEFYSAIGFAQKVLFPDHAGVCLDLSDSFGVMLITHAKWKEFTTRIIPDAEKTAQFGISVTMESKDAVDRMVGSGAKAGGVSDPKPAEKFDFMYGRSVQDPDGRILEAKWMDMWAMP